MVPVINDQVRVVLTVPELGAIVALLVGFAGFWLDMRGQIRSLRELFVDTRTRLEVLEEDVRELERVNVRRPRAGRES